MMSSNKAVFVIRLCTLFIAFTTSSHAFLTVMESSTVTNTRDFHPIEKQLNSLNYLVKESKYDSKFTDTFTKLLYVELSKSFGQTDSITDDATVKIDVVYAENLDAQGVKEKKQESNAAASMLEGTKSGFEAFVNSMKAGGSSDPTALFGTILLMGVVGIVGTDSEYVAVVEVGYGNQKTRVIAKTQRIGLSPEDAVVTLSKVTSEKIVKLLQGEAKWKHY